jgi:hypothetical protein
MESTKYAALLSTTEPLSPLLLKVRHLGLTKAEDLQRLAVLRGLRYYDSHGDSLKESQGCAVIPECGLEDGLTHEELAIALLSPAVPYSQQRIRIGAAMLAAEGNQPEALAVLAALALQEGCIPIVHYIAQCGHDVEPANPFWDKLLELLPAGNSSLLPGEPPHPTRFVAMTGITRAGVGTIKQWIRPRVSQPG